LTEVRVAVPRLPSGVAGAFTVALAWAAGCVPSAPAVAPPLPRAASNVRELPARPPVAVIAREGDPRGAVAVAILTAGVDEAAGPRVPVSLAAVAEARLAAAGIHDVTVAPTWDGFRIRALLPEGGDGTPVIRAVRAALLTPIASSGVELEAVRRKLAALARRPLTDAALADAARCVDEPALPDGADATGSSLDSLERWRGAAHGLGRVVFGITASPAVVDRMTSVMLGEPVWPAGAPVTRHTLGSTAGPLRVYDAAADVPAASARVTVVAHTATPSVATAAARALGDARGPLTERLRALDMPGALRDVTAGAQASGGCVAVTIDVAHVDPHPSAEAAGALATAVAIARQEVRLSVLTAAPATAPLGNAGEAEDPRLAADLAAWWGLMEATGVGPPEASTDSVSVGLGSGAEPPGDPAAPQRWLEHEVDQANLALETRAVDARSAVERGQGAFWILIGSPCGTLMEGDADAGLSALAVSALAEQARPAARDRGAELSEWVSTDGVGLLLRVRPRTGEAPLALARRAADAAGAALLSGSLEAAALAKARAILMTASQDEAARSFSALAEALIPGHPSWSLPVGTGRGLEAWSDGAVASRLAALRRGPLRVAVLGNDDEGQTQAAIQSIDRWVRHPPGSPRSCPVLAPPASPRPGTYAVPAAATAAAWIALPLPRGPDAVDARDAALVVAAALDGPDGLLARALSSGLASSWSARVVGPRDVPALVVRVEAPAHTLDAAVAQTRALLDRVRHGTMTDADRTRAATQLSERNLAASLTQRGRVVRLWRDDSGAPRVPPLDALHRFAADVMRDEALIMVASRPPPAKAAP